MDSNTLSDEKLKELSDKLGEKPFQISASNLVDLLNYKYKSKDNGKPFTFNDIQQYYLRERLPPSYSGVKVKMENGPTGKYLQVYKK